jgi:hypothetical protein
MILKRFHLHDVDKIRGCLQNKSLASFAMKNTASFAREEKVGEQRSSP